LRLLQREDEAAAPAAVPALEPGSERVAFGDDLCRRLDAREMIDLDEGVQRERRLDEKSGRNGRFSRQG